MHNNAGRLQEKFKIESCLHVNRSRYDWQPARHARSFKGTIQAVRCC